MFRVLAACLTFLSITKDGAAQGFADKAIQQFMEEGKVPGLFMAVVKSNHVLYQKSTGLADIAEEDPVTPNTCFELGSIAKAFTADLIYELEAKQILSLHDPITKYFPDAPQTWSAITIEHLLNHTSGIRNYLLDPRFHAAAYFTGNNDTEAKTFFTSVSTDSMVKMFYSLPVEFESGSNWTYSNTGYILLGKIAEKLTGRRFFEQVETKLSGLLQMRHTMRNELAAAQKWRAKGYAMIGDSLKEASMLTSTYAFSAGAWATSGNDMIQYLTAIHNKALPADRANHLWRELSLLGDLPVTYKGGRFYTIFHGMKVIFHNGGTPGFSSSWIYVPEKNISIIVLINRQDYAPIDQLAWNVLAHYEPALQVPSVRIKSAEAKLYEEKVKQFVRTLGNDTTYTQTFSRQLKTFTESESGKGLWRWIFERGLPTEAWCVDEETIGQWKAYRFRLSFSEKIEYRMTLLLNEKKEITQILWY